MPATLSTKKRPQAKKMAVRRAPQPQAKAARTGAAPASVALPPRLAPPIHRRTPTLAATPRAATLARAVDAHYNHLTSLQTRFTERFRGMGQDRTESGTLTLRKPGRMRWAYDAPAGKLFLLNNKDAISYTPGDREANRLPARQLDDLRTPLRFLLGHTDPLRAAPVDTNLSSLAGTPHGAAGRIRQVTLVVDTGGLIHSLQIDEVDDAVTTFTFTGPQENLRLPDSLFTFVPPPGVTVINGPAPM